MAGYQTLMTEDRERVRILTLNQPGSFNSLTIQSGGELVAALEEADRDPGIRVLVLTGAGKAFAAGGDIKSMARHRDQGLPMPAWFQEVAAVLNRTVITLRRLKKPVVAALNGVAAGGGLAWALGADLVVAGESVRLDPGYIRLAVSPDGGTTAFLTRMAGHKRASEFFLLGKPISAATAREWGLINRVVPDGSALDTALELAGELSQGPAYALTATKELLNRAAYGDLETVLENERRSIMDCSRNPDFQEGMAAFLGKRPPRFE